jgi:hypothetical protein
MFSFGSIGKVYDRLNERDTRRWIWSMALESRQVGATAFCAFLLMVPGVTRICSSDTGGSSRCTPLQRAREIPGLDPGGSAPPQRKAKGGPAVLSGGASRRAAMMMCFSGADEQVPPIFFEGAPRSATAVVKAEPPDPWFAY